MVSTWGDLWHYNAMNAKRLDEVQASCALRNQDVEVIRTRIQIWEEDIH